MTLLALALLLATPEPEAEVAAAPAVEEAKAPVAPEPDKLAQSPIDDFPKPEALSQGDTEPDLGWTLLRTLVVLGIVVMGAYVSLNWGLRRLLGIKAPTFGGSVIHVMERVPLDQRRSLFVVKAAGEYLLLGGGDTGLTLLSKLDTVEVEKLQKETPAAGLTLSPFLQKLLARKGKT